jgi:hypothetical protein
MGGPFNTSLPINVKLEPPNYIRGYSDLPDKPAVSGANMLSGAEGELAGIDPVHHQPAGVSGRSTGKGVCGLGVKGGTGIFGTSNGRKASGATGYAGVFEGSVTVSGDVILLDPSARDCAENFDVSSEMAIEPGTVVVIDTQCTVAPSSQEYDRRVAGVVSGAGQYKPAILLGESDGPTNRVPLALVGSAFCKVDATYGSIEIGDLLTTSATQGHAMKATNPQLAFGAVIGKALRPLATGTGLIPILIALQ